MSRAIRSAGEGAGAGEDGGCGVGREPVGEDMVRGKQEADALRFGFGEGCAGDIELVGFDEGLAGRLRCGLSVEEGVCHSAADDDRVRLLEQVVDNADLIGDFRATDDGDKRLVGAFSRLRAAVSQCFAHVGEFFLHEQTCGGMRDEAGDAFGRGVGAVGGSEGVVHVDVAEAGELLGEGGDHSPSSLGVKAEVLEKERLAGFEVVR